MTEELNKGAVTRTDQVLASMQVYQDTITDLPDERVEQWEEMRAEALEKLKADIYLELEGHADEKNHQTEQVNRAFWLMVSEMGVSIGGRLYTDVIADAKKLVGDLKEALRQSTDHLRDVLPFGKACACMRAAMELLSGRKR